MTSNVGSQYIQDMVGDEEEIRKTVMEVMRSSFKPEFLNRLDEIIIFHQLTEDDIKQIVEIQIGALKQRMAEREIGLELSDGAKDVIAKTGYDPAYGARPLKRTIQRLVQDPLATHILKGDFKARDVVFVDADENGRLEFSGKGGVQKAAAG